jgi:hypothetical protein
MKNISKFKTCLPLAALILTGVVAIPAPAQTQVPFKGTFQGSDTLAPPMITTTATGVGTHTGQLSLTNVLTLTSATGGSGTSHWIAANGDSIDSTFVASADFSTVSLGYITVTEMHSVTGGTGRFAGAQGDFLLTRTHIVEPEADGTHVTFGSFRGTITPPGAAH